MLQCRHLNVGAAYSIGMTVRREAGGKDGCYFLVKTLEQKHFSPSHSIPRHVNVTMQGSRHVVGGMDYIGQKKLDGLER